MLAMQRFSSNRLSVQVVRANGLQACKFGDSRAGRRTVSNRKKKSIVSTEVRIEFAEASSANAMAAKRAVRFRPCIDIHKGKVKQIVGSTLHDSNGESSTLITNFESEMSSAEFAMLYKRDGLLGGHVIMLGADSESISAAFEALSAYPGGLQVGGGINGDNARMYLEAGASHVIVTSYVFNNGKVDMERLRDLGLLIGKSRLVLDLSCRKKASECRECVDTLVEQVKILIKEMQSEGGVGDLIQRLQMVDTLQCLGIDRYFKDEIKAALDFVYGCWDASVGIGLGCESAAKDLNATALGLRVLRLFRYDVPADVLNNFKDNKGQFISHGDEQHMMTSMINLLRASSMSFPGEAVMEDAKLFSSAYLTQFLEKSQDMKHSSLLKEAEYALSYEWPSTFSRWEARCYIEIYELDVSRLKDKIVLELAKLDFNMLQYIYKMETKKLSSWWKDSGVSKLIAVRERSIEYYLLAVSAVDNAEFGSSRIALAKAATVVSLLDDLFQDYLTLEHAELVTKAIVQGWNISIIENIPYNYKKIVEFIFKTLHELTSEATQIQGRDMIHFITKAWAEYAEASLKMVQWNEGQYVPNYNEYIKFTSITRDDKLHGQTTSAISSYMKDHPECLEEEALPCINSLFDQLLKELTREYLNPNKLLPKWDDFNFNLGRGVQSFYVFGDGFSHNDMGIKQRVFNVLFDLVKV